MQRVDQEAYIYGYSFSYASSSIFYNNNSSSFNPTQPRVHPSIHPSIHPITHISPHSHSLGGKDDSCSCLASTANAGSNTNPGEDRRDSSHYKRSGNIGKVHSQKDSVCIDRSTRNSAEVYTNHKITIIGGAPRLG